jgi:uroporphyrin-III C-methyltransferase
MTPPASGENGRGRDVTGDKRDAARETIPVALPDAPGTVYLVGAGPGDPELLTLKAARLIESADVLCHDSLVGDRIVERFPDDSTEVVHVGKRPTTGRRWTQAEINRLLAREARAGKQVVRLKGGDPTVFARGGEEAEYLADRGIPVEFVPGITSPVAAPSAVGIPLTHREHASSLTVITGHEDPTKDESALDWDAIAGSLMAGGTLVMLMGVGRLADNVAALRAREVPAETPVAIVERATLPDSTLAEGTLETIVDRADAAGIEPPATVVMGDVVDIRETVAESVDAASHAPTTLRVDGRSSPDTGQRRPLSELVTDGPDRSPFVGPGSHD